MAWLEAAASVGRSVQSPHFALRMMQVHSSAARTQQHILYHIVQQLFIVNVFETRFRYLAGAVPSAQVSQCSGLKEGLP